MIVPMKKAVVIMQGKDSFNALAALRELGILHLEFERPVKSKNINDLLEELQLLNQVLNILAEVRIGSGMVFVGEESGNVEVNVRQIIDLFKRKTQLTEHLQVLTAQIKDYEIWGDFDPQDFVSLAEKNIFAGLFQIPVGQLNRLPEDIVVSKLSIKGGIANCLIISRNKIEIGFKEISLPQIGLLNMRRRRDEDTRVIKDLQRQLLDQVRYLGILNKIKLDLQKDLDFQEALSGMSQAESLSYISGYLPFDNVERLMYRAKQERWALRISEPQAEDNVPVLLRNPKWIAVINPIFKFLEILPGYYELDISLPFLIFFSIFFGMLIGDAGYGIVYFLITLLLHRRAIKLKRSTRSFFLFYILSFCAIIWGLCTGTFFGHDWVMQTGYKPLIPALNNEKTLQRLCFLIGAVHLSLAHIWRAILKFPALNMLADIGWTAILWACFFIARVLILGDLFPPFAKILLIAGIFLVIIFTNPQRNIIKGIGEGLGTLALSFVNNFTDVVSYIRLFAVGLAGVAIADAFNAMAFSAGNAHIFNLILAGFIILLGHSLGVILGPVGVLVHGVRLNVLEFSSHAGISWSGQNYKPFKK